MIFNKVRRKIIRLSEFIRYIRAPKTSFEYLGVLGINNLGDEALLSAIRSYFHPIPVVFRLLTSRNIGKVISKRKTFSACLLGGGTLIHGGFGSGKIPILKQFKSLQKNTKISAIFGSGIATNGTEQNWMNEWKSSISECDFVGFRGPLSNSTANKSDINSIIIGDPICYFVQEKGYWRPRSFHLGINVGRSRGNVLGGEDNFIEIFRSFISNRIKDNWHISFFVVWTEDLKVVKEIVESIEIKFSYDIYEYYSDPKPFLEEVRNMNAFVGMKLHSVALALCAGVPSLMLGYHWKCMDFMMSLFLEEWCLMTDSITIIILEEKWSNFSLSFNKISENAIEAMQAQKLLQQKYASILTEKLLSLDNHQ